MNEIVMLFIEIPAIICAVIALLITIEKKKWGYALILFGLSAWLLKIIISVFL